MTNFRDTTPDSRDRWEINADYWDQRMGDESNYFHRNLVRPLTDRLLDIQPEELVLDIACGTGNYSQRMAEQGAKVIAFDYNQKMIQHAQRRRASYLDRISFHVCDATDTEQLLKLEQSKPFDKAVSNMAIMDIADIRPLIDAVYALLKPSGRYVFSTHHPCFVRPEHCYLTSCAHQGEGILNQPVLQYYYHRSLQDILQICFDAGFILTVFHEQPDDEPEIPEIIIVRLEKLDI